MQISFFNHLRYIHLYTNVFLVVEDGSIYALIWMKVLGLVRKEKRGR